MASVVNFGRSTRRAVFLLLAAGLSLVALCALAAAPALAATTLNVSTTADSSASGGACSGSGTAVPSPLTLREAACLANNIGGEVNINVPAGEYKLLNGQLLTGLHSGQTVNFTGAGAASTILNAQGQSRVLNYDNNVVGNVKGTVTGLTIMGGAVETIGGGGIISGAGTNPSIDVLTIKSSTIKGNVVNAANPGVTNQPGGGVQMSSGKLTIENSLIAENSSFGSAGGGVYYTNSGTEAGGQGVVIKNTIFESNHEASKEPDSYSGGALAFELTSGEVEVVGSKFINNSATSTSTKGVLGAAIYDIFSPKLTVTGSTFTGNSLSGGGETLGAAVYADSRGEAMTLKYNRIVGNTPTASAVAKVGGTVDATENWWGCLGGPGTSGCDGTSGPVTSAPRLQFNASASPGTVAGPNGTSTVSAGFLTDSAGTAVSAANLGAFSGANVTWKEPTPSPATINGSTTPSTTALSAGNATAIYNSQTAAAGAGHATAAFDNASQTVTLTVDQKPAVTENPASQMVTPGATATFKAAASGTPTPTVQWERSTNGGSTFTAIPGATSTTYSFTAATGETGYQFRAVFTNTIEGTPYPEKTTAATLTVGKATTTLSSTATNAAIGGAVHDTATLGGGASPAGNLVFNAYGPNDATCSGAIAFTSTVGVSHGNGAYESEAKTFATVGEYRWTVSYSGDATNEPATSACNAANEKSTVSKAVTALSTTATSGNAGVAIKDTGNLSGGHNPTGNIVFRVFGPNNATCTGGALETKTVAVSGNGAYGSGNVNPPSAGEYRWTAEYSGDAENAGSTSACGAANETSTVTKVTPTLSTAATDATFGGKIHDTATLGAGVNPGGSVEFIAYGPEDPTCSAATPPFNEIVTVAGNGNYTGEFEAPAAGTYTWKVVYSGDGNNNPVTSPCGASGETSTVAKATPTISTVATDGTLGGPVHDTATLAGGVSAGGIITFKAFGPNDSGCTKGPVFSKFVAVSGNGEYGSTNFTPTAAGAYNWTAEYSGDGNNVGATSTCEAANETSTVGKASPTITTKATDATIGGAIHDTATLAGGVTPGGTITFNAFGPNDATCAITAAFSEPVTVTANGEYKSPDFTPATSGTYRWTAEYSGESNNNPVASKCNDKGETSTVTNATPTLSTTATGAAIGGAIHDTATLAGGVTPSGTITFKAFGPNDPTCATTAAFSEPVTVTANGEYKSPDFTPATAGSYSWTAAYSGDAKNGGVASACGDAGETSTVTKATPTISTTATSAKIGNQVNDSATIAGGHGATGNIVFNAYGPNDATCIGTPVSGTVAVNGDGAYGSGGITPTALGDYRWTAEYSGDANNAAVTSGCNAAEETSTISQATPTISTAATSATVGSPVHDTATIAGGYNAGGSIEFNAYGPNDATCTGTPAETETVTVNGNGDYQTPDFTPTALGDYRWTAAYSGDTDNAATASACNAAEETSTISQAEPTLSASATPTAAIGSPISDTATIAGGSSAGGSIVFKAFGPNDATCTGTVAFTETVPVNGDGTYGSTDFTPATAGDYRWTVEYTGDTDNKATALACNAAGQTSVVAEAAPTLATSATDAVLGSPVHDTATLAGGQGPTGTISFDAFAPNDATCAGAPVFTSAPVTVTGNGTYGSGDFTPTAVGAYRWVAAYSGDANNTPAEGQCGDAGETSTVSPVPPPPVIPPTPQPKPAPTPPALCTAPSATANGYVPTKRVTTGLVPGVRARIAVAEPSNLQIVATLKYRLDGKSHTADLGSALLENPGARNLRLALPASLREQLPVGTKVRLLLQVATAPIAGSPCAAPQYRKLAFKTKVVQVLVQH